jgi:predicted DNA-binding transcriptional regulator AlpA
MTDDKHEWLTTESLGDMLNIPLATIRHWRYVGTGPAYVKLGRAVRYSKAVVERWIADRSRGGELSSSAANR